MSDDDGAQSWDEWFVETVQKPIKLAAYDKLTDKYVLLILKS